MKKKITAAALALCLVLGLLPMSALAAQYKGTLDGSEITIDVDDSTGTYEGKTILDHYTLAPGTISLTSGKLPSTYAFTLSHYGEAPGTITFNGVLVEEPAAQTFTVSFAAGDHGTGTKTAEPLTVPEGESSVEYTLPNEEGFTPESGYVFSGWQVGDDTSAVKKAGEKISVTADVTLTAQWAQDETIVVVSPNVTDGAVTVNTDTVTVEAKTEAVILDLQGDTSSGASVTIAANLVTEVKTNDVKTVEVKTTLASVTVPVAALPDSAATLEVKPAASQAPSTVTVTASVSVTLTGVTAATVLATPIRITVDVASAPANSLLAYWNTTRNAYVRARGRIADGKATFLTRHLTDFAVVSEAEPEVLEVTGGTRSASAKVEPGETGLFVFEVRDGDGVKSIATTASAQSSSGEQVTVSGGTTLTGAALKSAYALEKAPGEFGDNGFTIAPADIMAEHAAG